MFFIVLGFCFFLGVVLFVFVFGIFILFFGDIIVLLCFHCFFCARPVGRARFRFVLGVFSCGFVLWGVFLVLLFGFICL